MPLGVNLCFAVKRMPEPERWAAFVREELGLDRIQFTFDLLDPWWPDPQRSRLIRRVAAAAESQQLTIESAFVGLAHYVPSGLLDPDVDARAASLTWWRRAIDVAADLGAGAVGGPLGTVSDADFADHDARQRRRAELLDALAALSAYLHGSGLRHLLIEPTPIRRETPATVGECQRLLTNLHDRGVDNVGLTLDTGHMVFAPLHGPHARIDDWLTALGAHVLQLHLDNTDRSGDPHWGWPHPCGTLDVASLAASLAHAGLSDLSVMLEVYPRFEDDSDTVRRLLISSVRHCRPHFPTSTTTQGAGNACAR